MFSVKGFAVGKNVTLSSGSAAAVIMASNIAASGAALKPAARPFTTLEELNRQALVWRDREAHGRSWPGGDHRTVAEAFAEERPRLLPLPLHRFDSDLLVPVRSGKTIYVRFDLNDYSSPPTAVGRQLTLAASESTIRILDGNQEIARHRRSYDRRQPVLDPAHQEELLKKNVRLLVRLPAAVFRWLFPKAGHCLKRPLRVENPRAGKPPNC
jgi:hypothetical protein